MLWVSVTVSVLILGLLFIFVLPRAADAVVAASHRPFVSIVTGIVVGVLGPIIGLAVVTTIVGIPLGAGVLGTMLVLGPLGYSVAALALGRLLVRGPGAGARFGGFLAGFAILRFAALVPVLGFLVGIIASAYGIGALVVAGWRAGRHGSPTPTRQSSEATDPGSGPTAAIVAPVAPPADRTRTPAKKTPAKKTPAKKTPAKKTPAKKTPAKKTPAKKTPAKKTPAKKTPAKKTPAKKTPAKKTPAKKTPAKKTPAKKTPAKKTPAKKTPAKKTPAKKTPAKKTPAKKTPAKKTPAKKTPAKKTPAKKTPAKKTPAKKTPAKKTPAKKTPAKKTPAKKTPAKRRPPRKRPPQRRRADTTLRRATAGQGPSQAGRLPRVPGPGGPCDVPAPDRASGLSTSSILARGSCGNWPAARATWRSRAARCGGPGGCC